LIRQRLRDGAVRLVFPPRRPFPPPGAPRRILVIRPDHLGDLLFATPALARLRAAYPDAHLVGLVGPWGRAVWDRQPALDAVETLPFPGIVARPERPWQPYTLLRQAAHTLRDGHYDLAVVLRFDYWWGALLIEQARIPVRCGYDLPATAPFLSHAVPYQPGRHEVEQDLDLVDTIITGAPGGNLDAGVERPTLQFPLTPEEQAWAAQILDPPDGVQTSAIHPGTNGSLKLWTLAGWAAVAEWLLDHGHRLMFTGSAAESPLIEAIRAQIPGDKREMTRSLAGQTTLGQLGALFARCRLVLGVDSGPLHIATAVGAPTLRLYGPSDERIWGPWGAPEQNIVIRAPGTQPGHFLDPDRHEVEGGPEMQAIRPNLVIPAIARLLAAAS